MNPQFQNIQSKYRMANIIMKVIYITVALFVLSYLINTLAYLFKAEGNFVFNWFALSPHFEQFIYKPWTIFTYGFLHSGIFHILFNMLVLYYIGSLFLSFFNDEQFITYYFLGIIAGGIIFMLSYNFMPALKTTNSLLVGASAGVTAVLVGLATLIPNYALQFRFIGSVPLKYLAIFFVVLDVIQIPNGNAGGHLAHLGGALIGFLLTSNFNKGAGLINVIKGLFKPEKKKPFKTVYKNKTYTKKSPLNKDEQQRRIDTILDKISKSGYESLSKSEKDFLFKAGKD